ncbi:MAG: transketolase [Proteobacteria bacterium]|nr:transketolase [Pseudomonadota bacterium]
MTAEWNAKVANIDIDQLNVLTLRTLAMDMIQAANSGHPGAPMGCAAMAHVLWSRHMRLAPNHIGWSNRDRFVLSNGHASSLLYALLHLNGYPVSLDDIRQFRQLGSITPGHPENHVTPGIDTTTGPLGQGIANAVGFALAETHLAARYNKPGHAIVDHYTYAICGDGCLMEGISAEAASLAGHWGLSKLIVLYDDNHITIDGTTDVSFTEDVCKRFEAHNWNVLRVTDGTDLAAIDAAITLAKSQHERPTLIAVRNHIGFGSPHMQDTSKVHGTPLGAEEIRLTKAAYGWPEDAQFFVPERVDASRRERVAKHDAAYDAWKADFEAYRAEYPELAAEFERRMRGELPEGWDKVAAFEAGKPMATRAAGGKVLAALHATLPELMGGSADLHESNKTYVKGSGDYSKADRAGRNLFFGIREHAMASIVNAMALYGGFIPYGATFLVFSDYMRHCIRLGALEKAHAFWVWTHDSIGVGEDGPTHQPVEHFASLRAIPDFVFIRPNDANETLEAFKYAVSSERPVGLALSRQNCQTLDRTVYASAENLKKGAYTLVSDDAPEYIILASGSEVDIALDAYAQLKAQGKKGRVVSVPAHRLFWEQTKEYRDSVLLPGVKNRVAVEAACEMSWEKFIGDEGKFIGMDSYGASAPAGLLYKHFNITADAVVKAVLDK